MKKTIKFAFIHSVPIMLGYLFLGFAFGLLLQNAGYSFWWALLSSCFIYAGSMQFLLVTLLSSGASLIYTAVMTVFINGRHVFYGLSFVDRFKKMGKIYPYMVFSLTDETYSVLCSLSIPKGVCEKWAYFFIALFDHCYWIIGSLLGALAGGIITFDVTGIDFSMTALFIVIMVEQWMSTKNHFPAILGMISGIVLLVILGPDRFIVPSLGISMVILLQYINRSKEQVEDSRSKEKMGDSEKI